MRGACGRVSSPDSRIFLMYYLYDLSDGWYVLTNQDRGISFSLKWDKEIFPVIWVWAPYGGATGYPWYGRNYNLAIEPWSAVPSNLAQVAEENRGIKIAPGQEIQTTFEAGISV